jgi:8-oxo-dGTP diphosphatase
MTPIVVAAAVIERDGQFLLTKRQPGVHFEGCWEFPGGKCGGQEPLDTCLAREIREELATDVVVADEILSVTHHYEDRTVELHFLRCDIVGSPSPQLGQLMRWVPRAELAALEFPPADLELIDRLIRESI